MKDIRFFWCNIYEHLVRQPEAQIFISTIIKQED